MGCECPRLCECHKSGWTLRLTVVKAKGMSVAEFKSTS
jgi:hypothetical protein